MRLREKRKEELPRRERQAGNSRIRSAIGMSASHHLLVGAGLRIRLAGRGFCRRSASAIATAGSHESSEIIHVYSSRPAVGAAFADVERHGFSPSSRQTREGPQPLENVRGIRWSGRRVTFTASRSPSAPEPPWSRGAATRLIPRRAPVLSQLAACLSSRRRRPSRGRDRRGDIRGRIGRCRR